MKLFRSLFALAAAALFFGRGARASPNQTDSAHSRRQTRLQRILRYSIHAEYGHGQGRHRPLHARRQGRLSSTMTPRTIPPPTAGSPASRASCSRPIRREFVQTPDRLVILFEYMHTFRSIPLNNRPHPTDMEPAFNGDSTGHWEGDEIVVDTVGLKGPPWTWLDTAGHQHSDALHVIERFRRTPDNIEYEYTVDDPKMYAQPWTLKRVYKPLKLSPRLPELIEYSCSENNRDIQHLVTTKPALPRSSLGQVNLARIPGNGEVHANLRDHFHRLSVQQRRPVDPSLHRVACRLHQRRRSRDQLQVLDFSVLADQRREFHDALEFPPILPAADKPEQLS